MSVAPVPGVAPDEDNVEDDNAKMSEASTGPGFGRLSRKLVFLMGPTFRDIRVNLRKSARAENTGNLPQVRLMPPSVY